MSKTLDKAYRGQLRQGFWLPFLILFAGIYFLIDTFSYDYNDVLLVKGKFEEYEKKEHGIIKLHNHEHNYFLIGHKKNEIAKNSVQKGDHLELMVKPEDKKVVQLKANDKMLFKRKERWTLFIFPVVVIIIAIILIPFVIKARRKNAKYFGDDKLFGKEKFKR